MSERTSAPGAPGRKLPRFRTALILICAGAFFLDGLIHSILGPLAPEIASELELSHGKMGPIFSANLVGQFFGLMIVPLLAKRIGHRLVVVLTLVGFGLFEAMVGLSGNAVQLFLLRMITGFFLGGCMPSCMTIVTGSAPIERRGLAIAVLFTGYGLGATMAGITANLFLAAGGWRVTSVIVGLSCLVFAAIAQSWLRGYNEASENEHSKREIPPGFLRGVTDLFSPAYLLGTLMLWLLFIAMLTISYCLISWLPTLLIEVGRTPTIASTSISIFSFGGIIAALAVGLMIDRFGATAVLVTSLSIASVILLAIGITLETASDTMLLALLGIGGFFFLGAYGGVNVVLVSFYPDRLRAVGIGWAKSAGRIGTIVAPIIIGVGLDVGMAESWIMSLFAVPAVLAALALVTIAVAGSRRKKLSTNEVVPQSPS